MLHIVYGSKSNNTKSYQYQTEYAYNWKDIFLRVTFAFDLVERWEQTRLCLISISERNDWCNFPWHEWLHAWSIWECSVNSFICSPNFRRTSRWERPETNVFNLNMFRMKLRPSSVHEIEPDNLFSCTDTHFIQDVLICLLIFYHLEKNVCIVFVFMFVIVKRHAIAMCGWVNVYSQTPEPI